MPDLTVTIPTEYASRVLGAFNAQADEELTITWDGKPSQRWSYKAKKAGENNVEFGNRVLRSFVRAWVKSYEFGLDADRYNADIEAITPPAENVPDDIVEE